MTIDLNNYSELLKVAVQRHFLNRTDEAKKRILEISGPFAVPCIAIVFWCGEVSNWPDYLKISHDSLMEFYGYEKIVNKPENCPW